jgi:hypothetical protein
MSSPSRKTALFFALGLLLALLLPSSNLSRLDGVPLATPVEVIALLLLAPMVMWREVREAAWALVQHVRFGAVLGWLLLGLVLAAKAAMLLAGPMQGWPACYRAGIAPIDRYSGPIQSPDCERSFDNPFFRGDVTRFDKAISFSGDTWNLGFINSTRFDFYDWLPDKPLRSRLPFEGSWSGVFDLKAAGTISVEYVGAGTLRVDGAETVLAPSYAEAATVEIPLAAGPHEMDLRYRFDDGSRSGQDPDGWGPRAMVRVVNLEENGAPLRAGADGTAIWRAAAWVADAALGLLALLCLLAIARTAGRQLYVVAAMLVAAVGLFLLPAGRVEYVERVFGGMPLLQVSFAGLAVILFVVHIRWRRLSPVVLFLALAVLALATMRQAYAGWDQVALRSAGNDDLIAESQARTILQTGSLQGEEDVFYAQPLYRYIKFAEHASFGEGDVLYGSVVLLVALGGAFFALERLQYRGAGGARDLLWLTISLSLLGLVGYYIARFVRDGMAEYPTWIAMLWAFPLLFASARWNDALWGALLLGLASITRTNQLPGNGLVLLVGLWLNSGRRWAQWLTPLAIFGVVGLLPLLHNLVYGSALVLTTTSAGVTSNLILGPNEWLGILRGEAPAWVALLSQVRMLFFTVPLDDWQVPVGLFAHIIMMAWLVVALRKVAWRNWREMVVLLLPLPYFLTHLVFVVVTYYPRHVIMGVLVMALSALALLASPASDGRERPARLPSRA